jgi:multisubunit Na+/H+ antiporter MnhC subunit
MNIVEAIISAMLVLALVIGVLAIAFLAVATYLTRKENQN